MAEPTWAKVRSEHGSARATLAEAGPAEPDVEAVSQAAARDAQQIIAAKTRLQCTSSPPSRSRSGGRLSRPPGRCDTDLREERGKGSTMLVRPEVVERVTREGALLDSTRATDVDHGVDGALGVGLDRGRQCVGATGIEEVGQGKEPLVGDATVPVEADDAGQVCPLMPQLRR